MADTHFGGHFDGSSGHVSGTGHDELDVVHDAENLLGGREEILGSLLHGDSAKEKDNFLALGNCSSSFVELMAAIEYGIVNDGNLVLRDRIPGGAYGFGQMRNGNDAVGSGHTAAFDFVDLLIDVLSGTVELGGVYVDDKGLAGTFSQSQAGRVSHPVVSVNNVKRMLRSQPGDQTGVTVDL